MKLTKVTGFTPLFTYNSTGLLNRTPSLPSGCTPTIFCKLEKKDSPVNIVTDSTDVPEGSTTEQVSQVSTLRDSSQTINVRCNNY